MKTLGVASLAILLSLFSQHGGAEQCRVKMDLLFIMDASGSIEAVDFPKELNFAARIAESFAVGPDLAQFGALLFSSRVKKLFCFDTHGTNQEVEDALRATKFTGGQTRTAMALSYARTQVFRAGKCGHRDDVPKVIILITDGKSRSTRRTIRQAKYLKNTGTTIITIGVGPLISMPELRAVASREDLVFSVTDFNALTYLREEVSAKGCQEGEDTCKVPVDLAFLLDSSRSLTKEDYNDQIDFVMNMTHEFMVSPTQTRVSVVQYAHRSYRQFCFNQHMTNDAVIEGIAARERRLRGSTKTYLALKYLRNRIFTPVCGSREGSSKIAILVTDGKANNPERALLEAEELKSTGVQLVTIGIGDKVDYDALKAMASSPSVAFESPEYTLLEAIKPNVSDTACDVAISAEIPTYEEECNSRCKYNLICVGEPMTCQCDQGFQFDSEAPGCVPYPGYQEECEDQCTSNLVCEDRIDVNMCSCPEGFEYDAQQSKCVESETCHAQLDVAFLLDASSSIGGNNFKKMTDFAAKIASHFELGPNAIQFSAVVYADVPKAAFCLSEYHTQPELEQAFSSLEFVQGSAQTGDALHFAKEKIFVQRCGARVGIPKVAIVVSDGRSDQPIDTIIKADKLKQCGVKIIVVGVGGLVSPLEMKSIASENQLLHKVFDYTILDAISQEVSTEACESTKLPEWDQICDDECASNLECRDVGSFRCRCADGYYFNPTTKSCVQLPSDGEPCTGACAANLVCQNDVCACESGYSFDNVTQECIMVEQCDVKVDLVLLLDASVSVGQPNFETELAWAQKLVDGFNIGSENTKVAVATYANEPIGQFCFNDHDDRASVLGAIEQIPYVYGLTNTGKALNYVRTSILTDACGQRPSVPKVVIVVSDGYSTNPEVTQVESQLLHQAGVRIISVAVGLNVSDDELSQIASSEQEMYHVERFDQLDSIRQGLATTACQEAEEVPGYGDFCNGECKNNLECIAQAEEHVCLCKVDMFYESTEGTCKPAPGPGESCTILCASNLQCTAKESGPVCECQENFSWDEESMSCLVDPGYQEPCKDRCVGNLECDGPTDDTKVCNCEDGWYFNPRLDTCVEIPGYNEPCTALCSLGLECAEVEGQEQRICQCAEGLIRDEANQDCVLEEQCDVELDLMVIMDSSTSVNFRRFKKKVRPFVEAISESFIIGPKDTLMSVITYNARVRPQFCFNDYQNNAAVKEAISKIRYSTGVTRTDLALQYAREYTFNTSTDCGAREGAAKVVLVVTDGNSTVPMFTIQQAEKLHESGPTVITVGIGAALSRKELFAIASENSLVFRVNDFSLLDVIKNRVVATACMASLISPGYHDLCNAYCRSNMRCQMNVASEVNMCECPPFTTYDPKNIVCL